MIFKISSKIRLFSSLGLNRVYSLLSSRLGTNSHVIILNFVGIRAAPFFFFEVFGRACGKGSFSDSVVVTSIAVVPTLEDQAASEYQASEPQAVLIWHHKNRIRLERIVFFRLSEGKKGCVLFKRNFKHHFIF